MATVGGRPPEPPRARTSAFSFRALAAIFAASTGFFVWFFVYELVRESEIRSGVATYALLTGLTTVGLVMRRSWGHSLALLISLASAGLGTLTLLSVIFSRDGSVFVPVVVLVASAAVAFWLSRPVFDAAAVRDE
jgi:hypothetical protein